jgi:hypothetical protein
MTLAFGTQQMTGFTIWGFYDYGPSMYSGSRGSVLYDTNYNITAAGQAYEALRQSWSTDVMTTVDASGNVSLPGAFYGDYQAIIDGKNYNFTFDPDVNNFVITAALIGDYNSDGVVDAADYPIWRDALGSTTNLAADGNGNNVIDAGDYDVWRSNFGNHAGSGAGASAAVPEPATSLLLVLAAAGWRLRRR